MPKEFLELLKNIMVKNGHIENQKNTLRLLKNILYRIDKYFKHIV